MLNALYASRTIISIRLRQLRRQHGPRSGTKQETEQGRAKRPGARCSLDHSMPAAGRSCAYYPDRSAAVDYVPVVLTVQ